MNNRETVENNASHHCCGTCIFFNGDLEDNEQFCDELEAYVSAKEFCCNKWKEKYDRRASQ